MLDVVQRKAGELTAAERGVWASFVAGNPDLASPYFTLGFLDAVASVRCDVRVLVIRREGVIIAFLPIHAGPGGFARPLGGPLSDVHGVISERGTVINLRDALCAGGVGVYDFHNALGTQAPFQRGSAVVDGSWVIDLSQGFEAYMDNRHTVEKKAFRNLRSHANRIEASGGYEFRADDRRPGIFETALAWKSEQYRRSEIFDVFSVPWTGGLLRNLLNVSRPDCQGVISSVEIGGELAAIHVGMRSATAMNYWFPVYEPRFHALSPGFFLALKVCEAFAAQGVTEVHLGGGENRFKSTLANWMYPVRRGFIATPSLAGWTRSLADRVEHTAESLPLGPVSTLPGRAFRRIDRYHGFHAA